MDDLTRDSANAPDDSKPDNPIALSVVIPVFEEEENVVILHRELTDVLQELSVAYEILFVDDGSQDSTLDCLRKLTILDPRTAVIKLARNYGQSAAIQAGFDYAQGAQVITMDGDLQNDPRDIPRLLEILNQGFDVVSGWRQDRQDKKLTRLLPSAAANWLIGRITGVRIRDNGCTLKAYRFELVKKARLYADRHRFLVPVLSQSGCRIREEPVNHRSRRFGTSKYGLSRVWKVALDLLTLKMLLRFSTHPVVWFAVLSLPFLVTSILSGVASIMLYATAAGTAEAKIILPSITVLTSYATANLLLTGIFAEAVVRVGDFVETGPLLTNIVTQNRRP